MTVVAIQCPSKTAKNGCFAASAPAGLRCRRHAAARIDPQDFAGIGFDFDERHAIPYWETSPASVTHVAPQPPDFPSSNANPTTPDERRRCA